MMQLYAAGFNAWNQLNFSPEAREEEPDDLYVFTKILEADVIERPQARLSYTLVRQDGRIRTAGLCPCDTRDKLELAYTSVETANGGIYVQPRPQQDVNAASNILRKVPHSYVLSEDAVSETWTCERAIKQIAAFDVGIIILHHDGSVSTMGDPRFEGCLGREVNEDFPANKPCKVPDLVDLGEPITQVSAGGYTLAALTEGGSLYVWGMASTGTHRRDQALKSLNGIPNYVEIDGGKDVQDVAVGESHAIVLTTDGCVYVIGDNHNGQLGVGMRDGERIESWTEVSIDLADGQTIIGVAAGPRSSFIIKSTVSR